MESEALSIGALADAVGLTRRAIRFYVQQNLLPPPVGRGRGSHYTADHLSQLRRVIDLQQAGHSLDAIRKLIDGGALNEAPAREPSGFAAGSSSRSRVRAVTPKASSDNGDLEPAVLRAELWTRLRLGDGIELSFDATKHNPTVEQLLTLRKLIRDTLL